MKTFTLISPAFSVEPETVEAHGVEFPDGTVVVRYASDHEGLAMYDCLNDMLRNLRVGLVLRLDDEDTRTAEINRLRGDLTEATAELAKANDALSRRSEKPTTHDIAWDCTFLDIAAGERKAAQLGVAASGTGAVFFTSQRHVTIDNADVATLRDQLSAYLGDPE